MLGAQPDRGTRGRGRGGGRSRGRGRENNTSTGGEAGRELVKPPTADVRLPTTTNPPGKGDPATKQLSNRPDLTREAKSIYGLIRNGKFRHQHDARKFAAAGITSVPEDLLMAIGEPKGLELLREFENHDMSVDVGSQKMPYSFQRVIIPCLAMLLNLPDLYLAKLRAVYNVFFMNNIFLENVLKCARTLMERRSLVDPRFVESAEDGDIVSTFILKNWVHMMLLITKFLSKYLKLDTDAAAEDRFKTWLPEVKSIVEGWDNVLPMSVQDPGRKELTNFIEHIEAMILPEAKLDAKTTNLRQLFGRLSLKSAATQAGPGELRPEGPRHDNDFKDFRQISIVPTFQETFCDLEPYLPKRDDDHHLSRGVDRYLDSQFRLVREDLLASLRRGISGFVRNGTKALRKLGQNGTFYRMEGDNSIDLVVFRKMHIESLNATLRSGIALGVSFDEPARASSESDFWGKGTGGKHLQKGSIVVLWFNAKKDVEDDTKIEDRQIYLAVTGGTGLRRPQVGVQLLKFPELFKITSTQLGVRADDDENLMFQVRSHFFTAGYSVLNSLQSFPTEGFPFVDELVFDAPSQALPKYIVPGTTYNLTCLLKTPNPNYARLQNVDVSDYKLLRRTLQDVREMLVLDETQIDALAAALTHSIAVIQGPPGCGKIYIGVHIMRVILENMGKISTNRANLEPRGVGQRLQATVERIAGGVNQLSATLPTLCVCCTNHALDQFLEDLVKAGVPETDIIRVGGRSQSEMLAARNLYNLMYGAKTRDEVTKSKEIERDLVELETKIREFSEYHLTPHKWKLADLRSGLFNDHLDAVADGRSLFDGDDGFHVVSGARNKSLDLLQRWLRCDDIQYRLGNGEEPIPLQDQGPHYSNMYDALVQDVERDLDELEYPLQQQHHEHPDVAQMGPPDPERNRPLRDLLDDCDVWNYSRNERQTMMSHWQRQYLELLMEDVEAKCKKYEEKKTEYNDINAATQLRILRGCKVLGMTTTGAASNMKLLHNLAPSIIVNEESGEVLEAHLIASLSSGAARLITIGDEKQLRPKVEEHYLSMDSHSGYDLDQSLFERLVRMAEANLDCVDKGMVVQLATQWRMRPEISTLLRRTLYPKLTDAPAVLSHPKVKGMRQNLYFFDHNEREAGAGDGESASRSKVNEFEAGLVVSLVRHLIKQGYSASEIAVLTPYAGQLLCLRKYLKKEQLVLYIDSKNFADISKALSGEGVNPEELDIELELDDEQEAEEGEEAKVVVISTVRCNVQGRTGFLKIDNRVNVMVSRAQHGEYIFGSAATIRQRGQAKMFIKMLDILEEQGLVGSALPLQCDRHPDIVLNAMTAQDVRELSPDGGCQLPCEYPLSCGHICRRQCHPDDRDHDGFACRAPCTKMLKCRHPCRKLCSEPCGRCQERIDLTIEECGHVARNEFCYKKEENASIVCKERFEIVHPVCKHLIKAACHEKRQIEAAGTPQTLRDLLLNSDRRHALFSCKKPCGAILDCSHPCENPCGDCIYKSKNEEQLGPDVGIPLHAPCGKICDRALLCGHSCGGKCHSASECPPCKKECAQVCLHAKCPKSCGNSCASCAEQCPWFCPHDIGPCLLPCGAPCLRLPCDRRCEKALACGHQCPSVCGEPCPDPRVACRYCAEEKYKDGVVDVFVQATLAESDPDESPLVVLPCQHSMTIESMDGITDLKSYYLRDARTDKWIEPLPLGNKCEKMPACLNCRTPISGIRRYARVLNHVFLDQTIRKFGLEIAQQAVDVQQHRQELDSALTQWREDAIALQAQRPVVNKNIQDVIKKHKRQALATRKLRDSLLKVVEGAKLDHPARRTYERSVVLLSQMDNIPGVPPRRQGQSVQEQIQLLQKHHARPSEKAFISAGTSFINCAATFVKATANKALQETLPKPREGSPPTATEIVLLPYIQDMRKIIQQNVGMHARVQTSCNDTQSWRMAVDAGCEHFMAIFMSLDIMVGSRGLPLVPTSHEPLDTLIAETHDIVQNAAAEYLTLLGNHASLVADPEGKRAGAVRETLERAKELVTGTTVRPVTVEEMREVFKAMRRDVGSFGGHWYTCPNGHVYTIGECGGAMERSQCPECGETVGGGSHQLAEGNRVAAEFLGAVGGPM
ncbi:uncharacterized protein EV422DRAFT_577652 [Fimicolochytrium jonesii]|uniref:uncharacterized protein n=1 Tax=Fimicolochytrium jonesii TaxID=1396493 RepID=UPI0022FF3178|nr:uncharacterized protein EV422DRAFT_577652 [Fimicolochytrium jonesii]KAI8822614.1 hypothetical protein EV422DRAFT_577652 [Fimicolochytrium jonesii]